MPTHDKVQRLSNVHTTRHMTIMKQKTDKRITDSDEAKDEQLPRYCFTRFTGQHYHLEPVEGAPASACLQ